MIWQQIWQLLFVSLAVVLLGVATVRMKRGAAHPKSVAVVVLGDLGRSPRIMYHAQSFARAGFTTYLVGYAGTPVIETLKSANNVSVIHVPTPPIWLSKLPRSLFPLLAVIKVLFGAASLLYTLLFACPTFPRLILLQTPPALPTLPMLQTASAIMGSKLIIDWHNTAYTILALRTGLKSPLVRVAYHLERLCGRTAAAHLFVTDAMRIFLTKSWNLVGQTVAFHDRPQDSYKRANLSEAHALFSRLPILHDADIQSFFGRQSPSDVHAASSNIFTFSPANDDVQWRKDRPALLVSSTSWTPDEDFDILIRALEAYEVAAGRAHIDLPKLLVLITGKGPLKQPFEQEVAVLEQHWKHVRVRTAWLESKDYPLLLGAADLGVSLHTSSSGLDLPMKIVDMFGAGLPVLAMNFACIPELVTDGVDGRVFDTAEELAEQLQYCLVGFAMRQNKLEQLRKGVQRTQNMRWEENWSRVVAPICQELLQ